MEWEMDDKSKIYSVFRSLVRIVALSSPSTSSVKNPHHKGKVLVSFGSPARARKFDYDLSMLKVVEEDDDTEIVSLNESSS